MKVRQIRTVPPGWPLRNAVRIDIFRCMLAFACITAWAVLPVGAADEVEPSSAASATVATPKTDAPEQSQEPATTVQAENPTENAEDNTDSAAENGPASETEPEPVGHPQAAGLMKVLHWEMVAGLKRREIESRFVQFRNYAGSRLDATAGPYERSEVTGNCRLKWYDHLLRNPLKAAGEAEEFTRKLHEDVSGDCRGLARALATVAEKLDLAQRETLPTAPVDSPQQALAAVESALTGAQVAYAEALATLTKSQIRELSGSLYSSLTGSNKNGHTLDDRGTARRMCDLMEKMDRSAMHRAAEALAPLTDEQLLSQLRSLPEEGSVTAAGVTGPVVRLVHTPAGTIVVGGRGANTYRLDEMPGVNVVIDLGGDDTYHEGVVSMRRPVLIVIDLDGNDRYRGTKPGVQGSAILGVSMLIDAAGDDLYQARDVAQGSALAGVGMLVDYEGDDVYQGVRRVQGHAIGGLGILIDRAGHDRYRAAMWAQGFGGPLGFGMLDDLSGNDHFFAGGLYLDSYPETPGYEGWSQGIGAGPRQVANGGIGVILDGGGDDVYEFDYMSHGAGYWCGTGFARDFGGNDQRLGATRTAYDGSPRREQRFQRFGIGLGCHYSLGFCFDDAGDDTYHGTIMGLGFAWDLAVGYLCDFSGNDRYTATGNYTQGNGAEAGLGVLFDRDGNDVYKGNGQGVAPAGITYHKLPACGGNFSFVVDHGGTDKYGCGARNNTYSKRGNSGGFLIDRPASKSIETTAKRERAGTAGGL